MLTGNQAGYILVIATIAALLWTLYRSREQRAEEHWDPSPAHPAARAIRYRTLPQPGRPVDGDYLSRDEWGQFVGILFASWRHVDEPEYQRGAAR